MNNFLDLSSLELPDFLFEEETPPADISPVTEPEPEVISEAIPEPEIAAPEAPEAIAVVEAIEPPLVEPRPTEPDEVEAETEVGEVELPSSSSARSARRAPPAEESDLSLPAGLIAVIDDMSESFPSLELQETDLSGFGSIEQLQRAAHRYDEVALNNDMVQWDRMFIGMGTTTTKISWKDMGFSPGVIAALKEANASQSNITLLDCVKDAGNELKGMRKKVQKAMLLYDGKWCCTAENYGAMCLQIAAMLRRWAELRQAVNEAYPEAKRSALVNLAGIMVSTKKMSQSDIASALQRYADNFPTLEEVNRSFRVEISEPRFRLALRKIMEGQVETAEMLARIATANRTVEEQEAIAEVNRQTARLALESKAKAMAQFDNRILKMVHGVMERLKRDNVKPGNLTKTMQDSITRVLEDLQDMTSTPWASSMRDVVGYVQNIERLAQNEEVDATILRTEIDAMLASFTQTFNLATGGEGHRSGVMPDVNFGDDDD